MAWGRPAHPAKRHPASPGWQQRARPRQRHVRAAILCLVGFVVLAATACRQDKVESLIDVPLPPDLPACADQYEDGKPVDYSSEGDFAKACQEGGELVTPVPTDLRCSDGRRLLFHEYAWGYQGDVMTLFDPEEPVHMPPEDEIMSCLRQDGEGAETESE